MQVPDTTKAPPISFSSLAHRYSLEEFWKIPEPDDRSHYELIGGQLFMVPRPDEPHGSIDARLAKSLFGFLLSNQLEGEVHHPRESIYRDDGTYLEPDMMYISNKLKARMGKKRTSADIVFEYVSRSNAVYDRTTKADTYLVLGIRELSFDRPCYDDHRGTLCNRTQGRTRVGRLALFPGRHCRIACGSRLAGIGRRVV